MSLHEVNAAADIDQQTQGESRIHQWRSMNLGQEETVPSNGNRDTTSLNLGQEETVPSNGNRDTTSLGRLG